MGQPEELYLELMDFVYFSWDSPAYFLAKQRSPEDSTSPPIKNEDANECLL